MADLLAAEARTAVGQRELPHGTDPAQLAVELGAILTGTNLVSVLHGDFHATSRARTATGTRLSRYPACREDAAYLDPGPQLGLSQP
jgi:hypothetical protein